MNEIQIFKNDTFGEVRVVIIEGDPWFAGKDVATVLGYKDTVNAIKQHIDIEDKKGGWRFTTPSGVQEMTIINESGVYSLVFGSKLPGAKDFKRWVTSEVLPSIRKNGSYSAFNAPKDYPSALRALADEWEKNHALEQENAEQRMMLAEYSPKASYYDVVLQTPDLISISKIAKDYGKSAQWMNRYLKEKGIQYKQGNVWLLRQKYAEQGYTKSRTDVYTTGDGETHSKLHTYWNQKGRLFIYDTLKQDGILPLIERGDGYAN